MDTTGNTPPQPSGHFVGLYNDYLLYIQNQAKPGEMLFVGDLATCQCGVLVNIRLPHTCAAQVTL